MTAKELILELNSLPNLDLPVYFQPDGCAAGVVRMAAVVKAPPQSVENDEGEFACGDETYPAKIYIELSE